MFRSVIVLLFPLLWSVSEGLWIPPAHQITETSEDECNSVYDGSDSEWNKGTNTNYSTIPEGKESAGEEGLNEYNAFSRFILCNVNKKRSLGNLNRVHWHFGLAYEAASYNACVPFKPAYTKWGLDIVGLSDLLIIFDDYIYLNNELNVYNRAAYQSVDQWFGSLRSYRYPIDYDSQQPLAYWRCNDRPAPFEYRFNENFATLMWSTVVRIGCATLQCPVDLKVRFRCLFANVAGGGPAAREWTYPGHSGEAFSLQARNLINANTQGAPFYGLPTCLI
ncbi:uncharacterized protein LOC142351135 [Convolutriloba macropyga]|uniref:uncharacterized protein LOC142351135 n=1 Tax=Convolutriloba macropyga TaxID=536237 RepID=UPI003F523045